MSRLYLYILIFFLFAGNLAGQELRSTQYNEALLQKDAVKKRASLKSLKSTNLIHSVDTVDLPFFDDFSYYHRQTWPSKKLWANDAVFVNSSFADSVISIGVATLDAADRFGNIYAVDNKVTPSDTLLSNYIKLGSYFNKPVYLSFFWQAGGKGEVPDTNDRLVLEFLYSKDTIWTRIWDTVGYNAEDSIRLNTHIFNQEIIQIADSFKTDGFRFRFRNYTSISPKSLLGREGAMCNADFWHLDYIQIKQVDKVEYMANLNDIMFTDPLQPSIVGYTSVPWDHYGLTNRFKTTNISPVSFRTYYPDRNTVQVIPVKRRHQVLGFNNQIIEDGTGILAEEAPFSIAVHKEDYINNDIAEDSDGKVVYRSFLEVENVPEGNQLSNDTLYRTEEYEDYYAYDDGVPELGFGVSGEGAYLAQIAIKFSPFVNNHFIDTLTGLNIYFNKTRSNTNTGKNYNFRIAVWENGTSGKPGPLLYAMDEYSAESPAFDSLENGFQYFKFDSVLLIKDTVIYVGIIQETSNFLNIGYDVNNDKRNKLYINTSNSWYKVDSTLQRPGTVMIRPVFGRYNSPEEIKVAGKERRLVIKPNPAHHLIDLELADENDLEINLSDAWQYEIYDCTGKLLLQDTYEYSNIDITCLHKGIYLVRIINLNSHNTFQNKLIKIE